MSASMPATAGPIGDTTIGITDPTGVTQTVAAARGFPVGYALDRDGYVAGGQIGYNHQIGHMGCGASKPISRRPGSTARCRSCCRLARSARVPISRRFRSTWTGSAPCAAAWESTANNWLVYGTAGLAYGNVKYTYAQTNVPFGGAVNIVGAGSDVELGWTAGVGVEYGWGQWSAKAEYLYCDTRRQQFHGPA